MPQEDTQFKKGQKPWNTGKKRPPFSEEWRKKMSEAHKGNTHTKGKHWKIKDTSKMSIAQLGNKKRLGTKQSEETKRKISEAQKGENNWNWKGDKPNCIICGKKLSARGCKVCMECRDTTGKNNHNWQGGKSFEIYPQDWSNTLKMVIRKRDNYTCQICKIKQDVREFSVHHIDYDKKNCDTKNLITLCVKCHTKTNYKRQKWLEYFKDYAKSK